MLGLFSHLVILTICTLMLFAVGLILHHQIFYCIGFLDTGSPGSWALNHRVEAATILLFYVVASLFAGYFLGFVLGWLNLHHPMRAWILSKGQFQQLLFKAGIFSILDERPISYEIFSGLSVDSSREQIVFLEIELKGNGGFIAGQVMQYAIVKDEEPHKPVVLSDVWYKANRSDDYGKSASDRVLVDLSDAMVVNIAYRGKQEAEATAAAE